LNVLIWFTCKLVRLTSHRRYCSAANVLYETLCIMQMRSWDFSGLYCVYIYLTLSVC